MPQYFLHPLVILRRRRTPGDVKPWDYSMRMSRAEAALMDILAGRFVCIPVFTGLKSGQLGPCPHVQGTGSCLTRIRMLPVRSNLRLTYLSNLKVDRNEKRRRSTRIDPNNAILSDNDDELGMTNLTDRRKLATTPPFMTAMSAPNLVEITSPTHFQELLSADLNRVSIINFWAPWAEPCKQMNEVAKELARKYTAALFLQVEAEEQSDIAESFDIEAVPSFIVLRGHTLLDRIAGADAPALTQSVAKHATTPAYSPLSKTNNAPAKAPTVVPSKTHDNEKESIEELNARLRKLMNQSKVVLFMKGSPEVPRCGFSRKISALLKDQNVQFTHFDILTDESVRQGLKVLNDWPTFPQLIVNGELVGGLDIVQEMVDNGEFAELIA
ncbi:unnamed protein product [Cyclocybe aegerita]|uniref:Thioredoxin domain-containing protein n=1 Tax=Cyclocybe aegerita TaxID=1973307 RepID=A0A8S0WU37_CYCAE|nr:unnamed protein product [Cyclocybe aegerita]